MILIYVARKLYFYNWFSISRLIYQNILPFLFRGGGGVGGGTLGALCANSVFWRFDILFFNHNRSLSTGLKKICSIKNVLFCFLIKTHFASLQTVFNYSEVSLCFSYFFFMWGQFDIYWYILEAGDFCPFMPIFKVRGGGRGANVRGGLCPTLAFRGGGGQGVFSPFSHPFSPFSHPSSPFFHPLFPYSLHCSSLFSQQPSHFSHPLSPFSHPFSPFSTSFLLSPTFILPCSLNPVRPYIPVKKSVCALLVLRSLNHSVEKTNCMRCRFTIKPLFCDITNSIFWHHKIDFLYQKIEMILWYRKIDFVISQNRISDIAKSNLWYHNMFVIVWCQKNLFCDITKWILWYQKIRSCDITKYEVFSTDEMMTPIKKASAGVFPPTKMADRTCRLETVIVCVHLVRMRFNYLRELSFF